MLPAMASAALPISASNSPLPTRDGTRTGARSQHDLPPTLLHDEVVAWCESALRQAEEEASQLTSTKLIPRIQQYLSNNQWPSRPTAYGTSRPVVNRMFRQYWELVSLLTDGNPEPEIKVFDQRNAYSSTEALLSQLLEYWASHPRYHDALQDVIGYGLLARGIGKIQWNPRLSGGMGDVELLNIDPLKFYTLGGDGRVENAECCIEARVVTLASLKRRFGQLAEGIEPDAMTSPAAMTQVMRPRALSSSEWSKLSPQMRRVIGDKSSGQVDNIYPVLNQYLLWVLDPALNEGSTTIRVGPEHANWGYHVEPGMPLFPRGRVITMAGKRILNDTCNPYFFAHHPYVEMVPLRAPWNPEGMSLMGNQIGPQDIINRITAGLLETIKASLIPTIITPKNAISRGDLDNLSTTISGGKMEYDVLRSGGMAPKFRDAPQIPQLAMTFLQDLRREMDQTTGAAAVDAAAQKEQIPSHDTMELIQNSRSSMVRIMGRSLENFMNRAGQMVVSTMLQFYSVGHRVAILGERGITANDFSPLYGSLMEGGMAPEEFVRKFQFAIRPGSALSFSDDVRAQAAMLLRRSGDLSRNNLFRALKANIDTNLNEQELQAEMMQKLAMAALAGQAAGGAKQQGR
jgi:hypothetical protein